MCNCQYFLESYVNSTVEGYQLEMVPLKKDWDWVQAEIAASFAHVLAYHDLRRLKFVQIPTAVGSFMMRVRVVPSVTVHLRNALTFGRRAVSEHAIKRSFDNRSLEMDSLRSGF